MDPRLETCRRWLRYHTRRIAADIFTTTPAPKERLVRREQRIDRALWAAERPSYIDEHPAAS
jgi:hypothetical protein